VRIPVFPNVWRNLWLKLLSLVLAFALWYVVAGEQGAEIAFTVPIEFRNVREGLEILKESVEQVDVRVRGSSEIVRRLTPQEIQVAVDLSGFEPGERTVYLAADRVTAPFGARVTRITPASLRIELDETKTADVRIVPRIVGAPADGFELRAVRLTPVAVRLLGPASRLTHVEQVTTEPISVQGLREAYTRPVEVHLEDPLIRVDEMSKVVATLDVREEHTRVELSGIAVRLNPPLTTSMKVRIQPAAVKVTVSVPASRVALARAEDLDAVVSTGDLAPGVHDLPVEVRPKEGAVPTLEIVAVKPARVRVAVTAK